VIRLARTGWPVIIGTLTVGIPARSPAAVVPASHRDCVLALANRAIPSLDQRRPGQR
jgi:hypothetical protein